MIVAGWLLVSSAIGCGPPAAVRTVQQHLDNGDLDRALKAAQDGLGKDPHDPTLRRAVIHVHLARGEPKEAVASYRKGRSSRTVLRYLSLYFLRWGLQSRDPETRLAAIHGVRRADADPLLKDMLSRLSDPNERVRTWASVALSKLPPGAEVLQDQLRSPHPDARAVALTELGRIAGAKVTRVLVRGLSDRKASVRAAAARALGKAGGPEALKALKAVLRDADSGVRAAAVTAVAVAGGAGERGELERAVADEDHGVKLAAVAALGQAVGKPAIPTLKKLADGEDLPLSLRAGVQLAKLGQVQPLLNAVARALVNPRWTVRAAACNAAGAADDTVAADLLRPALSDAEPKVQLAAARALTSLRQPNLAASAIKSLHTASCEKSKKDKEIEVLCLESAQLVAPKTAGTALGRLARQGTLPSTRLRAMATLLKHEFDEKLVVDALLDPVAEVSMEAAARLYRASD